MTSAHCARGRAVQPERYSAGRRARGRAGKTAPALIGRYTTRRTFQQRPYGVLYLSLIWLPPRMHPQLGRVERVWLWPEVLHESSSRPFRRDARRLTPVFAHHVYNGSQPPRIAPVSERRCRSARPITTRAQREGPTESDYGKERRSFGGGALFVTAPPSPRPSTAGRADATAAPPRYLRRPSSDASGSSRPSGASSERE